MRMQTGIPSADEKYFVIFAQTPTILYSYTSANRLSSAAVISITSLPFITVPSV